MPGTSHVTPHPCQQIKPEPYRPDDTSQMSVPFPRARDESLTGTIFYFILYRDFNHDKMGKKKEASDR